MLTLVALLLFLASVSSEEEFHCKPRSGCHLAQCDPVRPISLKDLERNEYPITCVKDNAGANQTKLLDLDSLLDLFSENRRDIVLLKKELEDLRKLCKEVKRPRTSKNLTRENNTVLEGCEAEEVENCFWIEVHRRNDINFTEAAEICQRNGSTLALITSEIVYDKLITFLRKTATRYGRWVALWTGMEFDTATMNITKPAQHYVKWYPAEPSKFSDQTKIVVTVDRRPDYERQGARNYPPFRVANGVICQKVT